jgi:hypothetical protein
MRTCVSVRRQTSEFRRSNNENFRALSESGCTPNVLDHMCARPRIPQEGPQPSGAFGRNCRLRMSAPEQCKCRFRVDCRTPQRTRAVQGSVGAGTGVQEFLPRKAGEHGSKCRRRILLSNSIFTVRRRMRRYAADLHGYAVSNYFVRSQRSRDDQAQSGMGLRFGAIGDYLQRHRSS